MKNKLDTKNLRKQKNTTIISTEESLRDIEPYFNNNYKRRNFIMMNINEFMEQVEKELNEKISSVEEKQTKLLEIEQMLQKMEQVLFKLFEQKAELEKELKAYEEQQQKDNARHISFVNFFEEQMNEESKK
jgi:hypothetical protein